MDIVGKIYRDFFIKKNLLDGNSHKINEFEFGGIFNVIKKEIFLKRFIKINNLKFKLIINNNIKSKIDTIKTNFYTSAVVANYEIPTALIFDNLGKRTSYILDDQMIKIKSYNTKNKSACIFYADKLYSNTFRKYDQLYLDTAGNSYDDLYALSKNSIFKKNTVISISQEYLSNELLKNFIKKKYIIISHSPRNTKLYIDNKIILIRNVHYICKNKIAENKKTTGLGDIFLIIISVLHYYNKFTIEHSIKKAQKIISKFLV
jgi:hypothetical protein